ncbi:RNA methyltransferase, TrmH family [Parageobacillus thermantarcticus]|uniref:RNA methyltransferase, TrmH family n=1 Tax=Parageobacillus thermantarcticus TaxID=186116 RepID=A0A1I0SI76_9BACL|nr:RNA methyltransferase [Parageobacillus thermantarcticus]SFA39182.1 RNA methyltransferase, TrmH family [Parageobacillus thermantarcticus]
MKRIESVKNPQVKQWKKLLMKKERDKTGLFLIEGFHLVEEALKSNISIVQLIIDEKKAIPATWDISGIPIAIVTEDVMKAISDTETPQGIAAVCEQFSYGDMDWAQANVLLIDAVQDPGNIGTMIRTADAAGIDAVILGKGCADLYNPKVIRATQGSLFHLPIIRGNLREWMEKLQAQNVTIYGTSLVNGEDYRCIQPPRSFALLVGNEGSGVSKPLLEMTAKNLYIPIYGQAESLNVAVAAGILLYHLRGAS